MPSSQVITTELAHFMASISSELRRQVGVVLDRRGRVQHVIVGDADKLVLPDLGRQRAGRSRFRGVRLVHTHVLGERLSRDDLTDLSLLQLDLIGVIQLGPGGLASTLEIAHLVPPVGDGPAWEVLAPRPVGELDLDFARFIEDLEGQFAVSQGAVATREGEVRGIAVHITDGPVDSTAVAQSLEELRELARTAGVTFVDTIIQRRRTPDPKFAIGQGKLEELVLATMHHDADLVVFDQDLTPAQVRSIGDRVELKVIDRTQLILDIFATRATSKAGKLQVELAQLKYALPRLSGRGTALSRLMGGIGGRGPGETKLEIDRRRAKDRIHTLQRRIEDLSRERQHRRRRRTEGPLPIVAIVGYTNAGKSTLLNALTNADVLAEDKLFATLDPTTRRLRFPNETEIVLTDTVGFIRDLPEDLITAFKATLEELADADLLLHVVDIATEGWEERMEAVDRILRDLDVGDKPVRVLFNKADRFEDADVLETLCKNHQALALSALDKQSLRPLTEELVALGARLETQPVVYA